MIYDYDNDDGALILDDNWEILIDSVLIDTYHTKSDAIYNMIEEIKTISNEDNLLQYTEYEDCEDFIYELGIVDSDSFYEIINNLLDSTELDIEIKLICLNDEEPEFEEL